MVAVRHGARVHGDSGAEIRGSSATDEVGVGAGHLNIVYRLTLLAAVRIDRYNGLRHRNGTRQGQQSDASHCGPFPVAAGSPSLGTGTTSTRGSNGFLRRIHTSP